jgi:hypothetical protein
VLGDATCLWQHQAGVLAVREAADVRLSVRDDAIGRIDHGVEEPRRVQHADQQQPERHRQAAAALLRLEQVEPRVRRADAAAEARLCGVGVMGGEYGFGRARDVPRCVTAPQV